MAERKRTGFEHDPGQQIPLLEQVLFNAQFDPNRSMHYSIQQLNIRSLASPLRSIRREASEDPDHREIGRAVYLWAGGRLTTGSFAVGRRRGVQIHPRNYTYKTPVMHMHNHPENSPPSPEDISTLLSPTQESSLVGLIVLTDDLNTLIMRGQRTPQWEIPVVAEKVAVWRAQVDGLIEQAQKAPVIKEQIRPWQVGRHFKAVKNYENEVGLHFMQRLTDQLGLRWFSGHPDAEIVTLQQPKRG